MFDQGRLEDCDTRPNAETPDPAIDCILKLDRKGIGAEALDSLPMSGIARRIRRELSRASIPLCVSPPRGVIIGAS